VAPQLGDLARVGFRGIEHVKLGRLFVLMKGGDLITRVDQLARPALLPPADSDDGLDLIEEEFAMAVAGLDDGAVARVAVEWAQTEEMRRFRFTVPECETVLRELGKLARQAQQSQQQLYYYWSL
jgi:hypothetical protein